MHRFGIRHLAVAAVSAAALVGLAAGPAAADASYKFPAGTLSPEFFVGGCGYKIWYGNFGNVPFAKLRSYNGCSFSITGLQQVGSSRTPYANSPSTFLGSDGCGNYVEGQVVGDANHIGVGEIITIGGAHNTFQYDVGKGTSGVNC